MNFKISVFLASLIFISFSFVSCQKGSGTASSNYGQHKSHNHGKACLHCHGTGGDNEFWWKIGGSIYKSDLTTYNPNGTVYLFKGKGSAGVLVKTIEVDGNGNIFTSSDIPLTDSLYVALQNASGDVKYMPIGTLDLNCNNCHDGKTNPRIWIK
ncbi:MAG: hypothetical protein WCL00_06860 [Bacteroidota bacterium]